MTKVKTIYVITVQLKLFSTNSPVIKNKKKTVTILITHFTYDLDIFCSVPIRK